MRLNSDTLHPFFGPKTQFLGQKETLDDFSRQNVQSTFLAQNYQTQRPAQIRKTAFFGARILKYPLTSGTVKNHRPSGIFQKKTRVTTNPYLAER